MTSGYPPAPPPPGAGPLGEGSKSGIRRAPVAYALAALSIPAAGWLSIWGLNGINHCNVAGNDCGLGFAVLIPLAWLGGVLVFVAITVIGLRSISAAVAYSCFVLSIALTWLFDLGAMSAYQPR